MGGMDDHRLSSSHCGFFEWSKVSQTNNQSQTPHVVIQKIPVQISLNLVARVHFQYEPGLADQLGMGSSKVVWGHSPHFLDGDTEHKKDPEIQKLSLNAKVTLPYIIIWLSQRLHSLVQALSEKTLLSKKVSLKTAEQSPYLSQFSVPHTRLTSAKGFLRETSQISWPMKYLLTMCKVN